MRDPLLKHMIGRTVASVEQIHAEYGRTYDYYVCIVFTDGEKLMLHGGIPHNPKPALDEMRSAPGFFTAEDCAAKLLRMEQEKRRREQDRLEDKRRELAKLKAELGES